MREIEFVVIGAGPTGLTVARKLIDNGVPSNQVLVLEKEHEVGGLCRSKIVDGYPLDIGGGHFLDNRNNVACDFLFRFLPEAEWNSFTRDSKIEIENVHIDYPLEANLWQLPIDLQIDYLESIAQAGCVTGSEAPQSFGQWVEWKFGKKIADNYMLPYNRKIWSMDLDRLGIYWLYKLPDVSFRDTLRSCLVNKAQGNLPAHGTFLYPKNYGYGEVWNRIGASLGESLRVDFRIETLDLERSVINGEFRARQIVNTIPWQAWKNFTELPENISQDIDKLEHVSIDVDYVPENTESLSHWRYLPDEGVNEHRHLYRSNFISGAPGYWSETNSKRSALPQNIRFHNEYAYPVNTIEKPVVVEKISKWAAGLGIVPAGRWGKWEHMNSDIAVSEAVKLANQLYEGR
jgi:protoporphyrinogen oxidase